MEISKIIILIISAATATFAAITVNWRIDRVHCNSSCISVFRNYSCKLKLISRNMSYFNMDYFFRPNMPLSTKYRTMVHFKWMHKSEIAQNYRMIIELKKIDFCPLSKTKFDSNLPPSRGVEHFYNWINETLGGFWTPCPWKTFILRNVTFAPVAKSHKTQMDLDQHLNFQPNGKNIFIFKAYSSEDPNILTFAVFSTFKANGNNWEY